MNPHMTIKLGDLTTRTGVFRVHVLFPEGGRRELEFPCRANPSLKEPDPPNHWGDGPYTISPPLDPETYYR